MKTFLLGFALSLAASGFSVAAAAVPVAPAPPSTPPTLAVIVVDAMPATHTAFDAFNFIAEDFGNAFEARHWPLRVTFDRFAANNESSPIELKIYHRGIKDEFGERWIREWVTLTVNGTKHDFGIVLYRYLPRAGEPTDDMLHRVFRAEGEKIADLIQPYLVPTTEAK